MYWSNVIIILHNKHCFWYVYCWSFVWGSFGGSDKVFGVVFAFLWEFLVCLFCLLGLFVLVGFLEGGGIFLFSAIYIHK